MRSRALGSRPLPVPALKATILPHALLQHRRPRSRGRPLRHPAAHARQPGRNPAPDSIQALLRAARPAADGQDRAARAVEQRRNRRVPLRGRERRSRPGGPGGTRPLAPYAPGPVGTQAGGRAGAAGGRTDSERRRGAAPGPRFGIRARSGRPIRPRASPTPSTRKWCQGNWATCCRTAWTCRRHGTWTTPAPSTRTSCSWRSRRSSASMRNTGSTTWATPSCRRTCNAS